MSSLANSELEQALLGAVFHDNRVLNAVSYLEPEDFAFAAHQAIWIAVDSIRAKGHAVTPPAVCQMLADNLGDVGGTAYIGKLATAPLGTLGAEHWAKLLRDLAMKRRIRAAAQEALETLDAETDKTAEELTADLMSELERMTAHAAPKIRDAKDIRIAEAEGMKRRLPCYSTGYDCIDRAMAGGLYARRAYAIAARKKSGKTLLAGDISDNLNRAGVKHLFIACEMGPDQIEHRTMAKGLGVNALAFLDPRYREQAWFQQKVAHFAVTQPANAMYLDSPGLTFDQMRREVTHAILAHGVKGFILDYLQLVGGQRRGQSKAEHLDEISQWIAETCKSRNVWALVLAQINQEGNVRGGEGIRLAFDQVYELKKPEGQNAAWLEMLDSRYTKWTSIGSETAPAFMLETSVGPHFRELDTEARAA